MGVYPTVATIAHQRHARDRQLAGFFDVQPILQRVVDAQLHLAPVRQDCGVRRKRALLQLPLADRRSSGIDNRALTRQNAIASVGKVRRTLKSWVHGPSGSLRARIWTFSTAAARSRPPIDACAHRARRCRRRLHPNEAADTLIAKAPAIALGLDHKPRSCKFEALA